MSVKIILEETVPITVVSSFTNELRSLSCTSNNRVPFLQLNFDREKSGWQMRNMGVLQHELDIYSLLTSHRGSLRMSSLGRSPKLIPNSVFLPRLARDRKGARGFIFESWDICAPDQALWRNAQWEACAVVHYDGLSQNSSKMTYIS
jgi:hypothetical protein